MQPRDFILVALLCLTVPLAGCQEKSALARLPDKAEPANVAATMPSAVAPATAESGGGDKAAPVLSGTLEPHRRSTLMPKVGGWVIKVHVAEGDVVKRGAALVAIDPAQYRLTMRQAEAGLEAARVGLDATKLEYDRHKALLADKAVPQGQFDMVDAKYKGALVQVKAAEVARDMAAKALRDTTVFAPYTGVVIKKHVSEGDNAAAMPPTPLITMEETETLDLRVQVPASDSERVKAGDEITVHFPSGGSSDIRAKITRVVPTINPGTRTFSVIVQLDNADGKLRAGLFAEVRLGGAPAAAIADAPAGARAAVLAPKATKKPGAGK
ncbi:MAG TPA: efflux RND transporter periplasmic adaptor subunit [Polyangia bacterium]|jgi:RND family efflux transporter MFP subunit